MPVGVSGGATCRNVAATRLSAASCAVSAGAGITPPSTLESPNSRPTAAATCLPVTTAFSVDHDAWPVRSIQSPHAYTPWPRLTPGESRGAGRKVGDGAARTHDGHVDEHRMAEDGVLTPKAAAPRARARHLVVRFDLGDGVGAEEVDLEDAEVAHRARRIRCRSYTQKPGELRQSANLHQPPSRRVSHSFRHGPREQSRAVRAAPAVCPPLRCGLQVEAHRHAGDAAEVGKPEVAGARRGAATALRPGCRRRAHSEHGVGEDRVGELVSPPDPQHRRQAALQPPSEPPSEPPSAPYAAHARAPARPHCRAPRAVRHGGKISR